MTILVGSLQHRTKPTAFSDNTYNLPLLCTKQKFRIKKKKIMHHIIQLLVASNEH